MKTFFASLRAPLLLAAAGAQAGTGLTIITPTMYSAYGDGRIGTTGVVNNSRILADANASWASTDVGKEIFVVGPQQTRDATFVGTISAVNSATSITLSGNPGWSASSVEYYYGHDDSAAFAAASEAVAHLVQRSGYIANYANYSRIACLTLQDGAIYLVSRQQVIAGSYANTAPCWRSAGEATVVIGGLSDTTDGVVFGSGSTRFAKIQGVQFDCVFSGHNCVSWQGFQNPIMEDVAIENGHNDCLEIAPSGTNWIQQGHVSGLLIYGCGNNGINIAVSGTRSFANETDFEDLVIASVSSRVAGGTAFLITSAGQFVDSWAITNWKFSQAWRGDSAYQPAPQCIIAAANVNAFTQSGISFRNGYCEENPGNGSVLGAGNAPIAIPHSSSVSLTFDGFTTYHWGEIATNHRFNGMGYWALAHGASKDLLFTSQYYGYTGTCVVQVNDGANTSTQRLGIVGQSQGAPIITTLGTSTSAGAPSYTVTGTVSSGVEHVTFNNTGSSATETVTFACTDEVVARPPHFNWN